MTVRIPVSADATATVSAFRQIREALRNAAQEGKAFADLDFAHPELTHMREELERIQQQFTELRRMGGATAGAVRATGAQDVLAYGNAVLGGAAGTPAQVNAAGGYMLGQTRFTIQPLPPMPPPPGLPPPPGPPSQQPPPNNSSNLPPPPPGGGGGGGGGGIVGGLLNLLPGMRTVRGLAGTMLGAAGIHGIHAMISQSVSGAQNEATANNDLGRTLRDVDVGFRGLRDIVRETGQGLGITHQEAQRLSMSWARLTNETNAATLSRDVRFASGVARAYGLEPDAMVRGLGAAAYQGEDPRRFAGMVAQAVEQGGMSGRTEEVMNALLRATETANRQLTTSFGTLPFTQLYTALNQSGMPGLRGQNAENLIGQINGAVTNGGAAGEASTFLSYRALSRHGLTNPYDIQRQLEGGMFEQVGSSGRNNFQAMYEELSRQYQGRPDNELLHALGRHFGITMRQADGIRTAIARPGGNALLDQLRGAGVNLDGIDATSWRDLAAVGNASDLEPWRRRALDRRDLTGEERGRIEGAQGEDLRGELLRALARAGGETNDGTEVRTSQARWANSLTEAGTALVPVMNSLRDVASNVGEVFGSAATAVEEFIAAMRGNGEAGRRSRGAWGPHTEGVQSDIANGITPASFSMGGGSRALPGGEQMSLAAQAHGFFTRRGWTSEQAAGLVANIDEESGFRAGAVGDGGRAFGIAQWHPDRQAEFRRWSGRDIQGSSFEDQLAFMQYELTQGREQAAGRALRGARSAGEAGAAVSTQYERPAARDEAARNRARRAEDYQRRLGGTPIPGGLSGGRGDVTASLGGSFAIAPLRVEYLGPTGEPIGEQYLPVTRLGTPVPSGLA